MAEKNIKKEIRDRIVIMGVSAILVVYGLYAAIVGRMGGIRGTSGSGFSEGLESRLVGIFVIVIGVALFGITYKQYKKLKKEDH